MLRLREILKEIRKIRGIQAKDMAKSLGMSPSYLTLIEKEERAIPLNFIQNINSLCQLTQKELSDLINAINHHPLSDKNTRQRQRINAVMNEVMQIASNIFTKLLSKLNFDYEIENSLSNLIEMLQNLKQKIFNNEESELENRLI